MESQAYLDNRTCKRCGRFDMLCQCRPDCGEQIDVTGQCRECGYCNHCERGG
ncbi:Uncharacterised protein [Mycobacteroides abscessus subsp. massiliense]|nr:Uncharacterised protein [Mycobacteroides abscessus subsp. massiliense]